MPIQYLKQLKASITKHWKRPYPRSHNEGKTTTTYKSEVTSTKPVADDPAPEEDRMMNYINVIEPSTWIKYDNKTLHKVNGLTPKRKNISLLTKVAKKSALLRN